MRCWLGVFAIGMAACAAEAPPTTAEEQILDDDSCGTIGGDHEDRGRWFNHLIPHQYGRFEATFVATPAPMTGATVDAVIGFASDEADAFTDLGPIVRFNPQGFFDARNGSSYMAATQLSYTADWTHAYQIRFLVDIPARRYSAWVTVPGQAEVPIATNYAFRSEQSAMSRISMLAGKMDSDGFVNLCYLHVGPPICKEAHAGGAWVNTAFPRYEERFGARFVATPAADNIDAVIGLSRTTATRFTDLAAIVRFNPAGYIDARDGSTYRADVAYRYHSNQEYDIFFSTDFASGRYFVSVTGPQGLQYIANGYRFRTEQTGVTSLSSLGQFIDSATGSIRTCELSSNETPW